MRGYEIEETYVSLETAKLAKEKGFNVFLHTLLSFRI